MMKAKKSNKILAGVLTLILVLLAVPMFSTPSEADTAPGFTWGYPNTEEADAGMLPIKWKRGGYYSTSGAGVFVASKDHSYTEDGIVLKPNMKIWFIDLEDPAGYAELAVLTFYTDDTFTTCRSGGIAGSRDTAVYYSMNENYAQSKYGTKGVCYTYWNKGTTDLYVKLSYRGISGVPVFYSYGEPELLGENNVPLPRKLLNRDDLDWTYGRIGTDGVAVPDNVGAYSAGAPEATLTGYMYTANTIAVAPGQTIALFGDKSLNAITGESAQKTDSNYVFLAYNDANGTSLNTGASLTMDNAKNTSGEIENTGAVVYEYTNYTTKTLYVKVCYCPSTQRSVSADAQGGAANPNNKPAFQASNVYLYEPVYGDAEDCTYLPIRSNTGEVQAYFTNANPEINDSVFTPPVPPASKEGYFIGWKLEYTNQNGVKEGACYPPNFTVHLTTFDTVSNVKSEITMDPVYIDSPPYSHDGASVRALAPTGLQFKLYFLKEDFDKMQEAADAEKSGLSIGAFTVPSPHMDYFLTQVELYDENDTRLDTTAKLKNAVLRADSQTLMDEKFTMAWFDENEDALRDYIETLYKQYGAPDDFEYTAALYVAGYGRGTYYGIETIDNAEWCTAFFTVSNSYKGTAFGMDYVVRPMLAVKYEIENESGAIETTYSNPYYGTFKTSNVRNTEEVLMACLRSREETLETDGIQYFTENQADLEDTSKFGKWNEFHSLTYHDPNRGQDVTVYTRRFSGPTILEITRILKPTQYAPKNG